MRCRPKTVTITRKITPKNPERHTINIDQFQEKIRGNNQSHQKSSRRKLDPETTFLAQRVIEENDMSFVPKEKSPDIILYLQEYTIECFSTRDFAKAKAIDGILAKNKNNTEEIKSKIDDVIEELNRLLEKHQTILDDFDKETDKLFKISQSKHVKELEEFETKWLTEIPKKYQKPSPSLLQLKKMRKNIILARDFQRESIIKREIIDRTNAEKEAALNHLLSDYEIAKNRLLMKHKKELNLLFERRTKEKDLLISDQNLEISVLNKRKEFLESSKNISHKKTHVNQIIRGENLLSEEEDQILLPELERPKETWEEIIIKRKKEASQKKTTPIISNPPKMVDYPKKAIVSSPENNHTRQSNQSRPINKISKSSIRQKTVLGKKIDPNIHQDTLTETNISEIVSANESEMMNSKQDCNVNNNDKQIIENNNSEKEMNPEKNVINEIVDLNPPKDIQKGDDNTPGQDCLGTKSEPISENVVHDDPQGFPNDSFIEQSANQSFDNLESQIESIPKEKTAVTPNDSFIEEDAKKTINKDEFVPQINSTLTNLLENNEDPKSNSKFEDDKFNSDDKHPSQSSIDQNNGNMPVMDETEIEQIL